MKAEYTQEQLKELFEAMIELAMSANDGLDEIVRENGITVGFLKNLPGMGCSVYTSDTHRVTSYWTGAKGYYFCVFHRHDVVPEYAYREMFLPARR